MNRVIPDLLRRCASELGTELNSNEIGRFCSFAEELKKWNRKMNLTAIRDDREIVIKHFADSLTLLTLLGGAGTLLDIGSGAGFPAIPLKIMLPSLSIVSVDSVEKKILFQRHVARRLGFADFAAIHARGEELAKNHAGRFDWIVSRAFSDLPYFIGMALPLLKVSGKLVAMKGRHGKEEIASAGKYLADLGVKVNDCIHVRLPLSGDDRYLISMDKSVTHERGNNIQ